MSTFLLLLGVVFLVVPALAVATGVIRYIPNHQVGIKEKLFSSRGSVTSGVLALDGEAGFEPDVLRGGWHLFWPLQYRVHRMPLVTIPQGQIGYVFARDGALLPATQTLALTPADASYEDVRAFLAAGGQRGPQRRILREGSYAINLAQFAVFTEKHTWALPFDKDDEATFARMAQLIHDREGFRPVVIRGADDVIGVVTVHDGPSLPAGEIIAPAVGNDPADAPTWHNNFQDPERFLAAGGRRGRQLQVLVDGTWYLNRLFATVELVPKTVVEVGYVGVVVSYTGGHGSDLSGVDYKHGELVAVGERGVWSSSLLPGKYAFNTYAGKVVMVPTTNFILKWTKGEVGSHRFDENLAEVSLITKDAFEPSLPLSVVVHIDYRKAPLVVQRFGDIKRLVEQTLDPMVAAYFKNIGQTRTLIQLIHERADIQRHSCDEMREKFGHYNLELEEVLIGTPGSPEANGPIEQILAQIRARQLADEQVETYARQERAAVKERELREAEAHAHMQTRLTESEIGIAVETNQGRAEAARAVQDADRIRTLAEAEAEREARVGVARALAAEEQVRAYGGPGYQVMQAALIRFAEAVEHSGVEVVPRVVVGQTEGSGGAFESLLGLLLAHMGEANAKEGAPLAPPSPEAEALRAALRARIAAPAPRDAAAPTREH